MPKKSQTIAKQRLADRETLEVFKEIRAEGLRIGKERPKTVQQEDG